MIILNGKVKRAPISIYLALFRCAKTLISCIFNNGFDDLWPNRCFLTSGNKMLYSKLTVCTPSSCCEKSNRVIEIPFRQRYAGTDNTHCEFWLRNDKSIIYFKILDIMCKNVRKHVETQKRIFVPCPFLYIHPK